MSTRRRPIETLPDVRDGLTRLERLVLVTLQQLQAEKGERGVPTAELYGRLVERLDATPREVSEAFRHLVARGRTR